MAKQIIAMGGGGFSMEPDNPLLDEYFLKQTHKRNPRVCFLPTASGDADSYVVKFYASFTRLPCRPSHLSLFRPPDEELEAFLLDKDAIYVGGGNTKSLMALWREWGLDRILRKAWQRGVLLGGVSAGALCWFEDGVTDSLPGRMTRLECLGFLRGSHCPHYTGQPRRRPAYHDLVGKGTMRPGVAADDGVALHYVGRKLTHVVSSRPEAQAYRVSRVGGLARERPIPTRYLGA